MKKALLFWQNLSNKDKRALTLWIVVVFSAMIYNFIWYPISNEQQHLNKQFISKQSDLTWAIKKTDLILSEPKNLDLSVKTKAILSVIEKDIKNSNISENIIQIQQVGDFNDRKVSLQLSELNFDDLVSWIFSLSEKYGIYTANANLNSTNTTGKVIAEITLTDK